MKIKDILNQGKPTLSFEVFPPKTEDKYESVEHAAAEIAKLSPAFMSGRRNQPLHRGYCFCIAGAVPGDTIGTPDMRIFYQGAGTQGIGRTERERN